MTKKGHKPKKAGSLLSNDYQSIAHKETADQFYNNSIVLNSANKLDKQWNNFPLEPSEKNMLI